MQQCLEIPWNEVKIDLPTGQQSKKTWGSNCCQKCFKVLKKKMYISIHSLCFSFFICKNFEQTFFTLSLCGSVCRVKRWKWICNITTRSKKTTECFSGALCVSSQDQIWKPLHYGDIHKLYRVIYIWSHLVL